MANNVPAWVAQRNGLPGNLDAVNDPNAINQYLGSHPYTPIYQGAQIVTPVGGPNFMWLNYGNATDLDQPFTLPAGHTAIGRVTVPVQPVGNGTGLLVSLCPDNGSGAPNTSSPAAQSFIPASWVNQFAATGGLPSAGPLATGDFNTLYATGGLTTVTWVPASGGGGFLNQAAFTSNGNYGIFAGGYDGTNYFGTTYTVQFNGSGSISLPVAQPTVPTGVEIPAITTTNNSVVIAGGITGASSFSANVWTGSWDPNTGTIGSWSLQTALPVSLYASGSAASGNTVYIIGGINSSGNNVSTVYYSTLNNGQISSWNTGPALPATLSYPFVAVLGNLLVVAGGAPTSISVSGSTGVYYAIINSDGSLGSWNTGPSLPIPVYAQQGPGWNQPLITDAMAIVNGFNSSGVSPQMMVLTYANGVLAKSWVQSQWPTASIFNKATAAFPLGNGQLATFNISPRDQYYEYSTLTPAPLISVPLAATGLTAGATYHVVLQQEQAPSASDYLNYGVNSAALSANALKSPRHSGTWSTALSGYSVPVTVYDNTPSGGLPLHTWADTGAQTETYLTNSLGLLIGYATQTTMPNNPLNSNPTFTSGVSPWTATNGTIAQSNAQTQGGYAFSGLLTPTGGFTQAYASTELVPVSAGQWYLSPGWFYSPTGWANVHLNMDWYDSGQSYLSTSSGATVSLAATTWTQPGGYFQAPAGAAYGRLSAVEGGSPGAANVLYLSNVLPMMAPETVGGVASVAQINYAPGAQWPPVGVTQLA